MKKISFSRNRRMLLIGAMLLLLMVLCGQAFAEGEEVLPAATEEPSGGCVWVGVYGDYCEDAAAVLARINEIRLEACQNGVPDPRNSSRALTMDDYVPIKWSEALEQVARIRASEALFIIGHERHNGKNIWQGFSISSNGEVIAWNYGKTMVPGVNQWYGEKADWLKEAAGEEHGVTGHYTEMIDPNNRYVGVGGMYSTSGIYRNATVGRYSTTNASLSQSYLPVYTGIIQKMDVLKSYLGNYSLTVPAEVAVGATREATVTVQFIRENRTFNVRYMGAMQFTSSNTAIATVDSSGRIRGVKAGTANITVSVDGNTIGTQAITVVGGYDIANATVTLSATRFQYDGTAKKPAVTVTYDGNRLTQGTDYTVSYSNNVVVGTATVTVTGKGSYTGTTAVNYTIFCDHNNTYGELNENNQMEADCSICGAHFLVTVPTTFTIYWRNSETAEDNYYYPSATKNNPVGSNIDFLVRNMDGDDGYQDLIISISDTAKLNGTTETKNNGWGRLNVLGSGAVMVTVSVRWNPKISSTYTFMLGDTDISLATIQFSRESVPYTGSEVSNAPSVYWGSRSLSKGTDYTISYRNNVNIGTATVTITGIGDFHGSIEKTFRIVPKQISGACVYRGTSALLSENIVLQFQLRPVPSKYSSYPDTDPYVVFTVDGEFRAKQYLKDAETTKVGSTTYYNLECPINIKEISDTVTITFYANDSILDATPQTYSVKQYCQALIDGNYSAEAKALAKALLTYSAYARQYFNYKTGSLGSADYQTALPGRQAVVSAISGDITVSGQSKHIGFDGLSLLLLSETGMRFYVTPDATILASDSRITANENGTRYYIPAPRKAYLGTLNVVQTVQADGLTVSASPLHYIKSVLQMSGNTKLVNLCLAMYNCYTAAAAYTGQ